MKNYQEEVDDFIKCVLQKVCTNVTTFKIWYEEGLCSFSKDVVCNHSENDEIETDFKYIPNEFEEDSDCEPYTDYFSDNDDGSTHSDVENDFHS